jgi:mannitol-1-phosphate/altronate dehydrogenase
MPLAGTKTFVGFGFGAIQAGLFLYEAFRSGQFGRMVVAEVQPDLVRDIRRAEGWYSLNIAHLDGVKPERVGPIEILDPACESDRERLVAALADADEIATAVPAVDYYVTEGPSSIHLLFASGIRRKLSRRGSHAVVYAAENHNQAAEILETSVHRYLAEREREHARSKVQFLNTVIGKMSGMIADPFEIGSFGLAPITPDQGRAFLVESFNQILISKISFSPCPDMTHFERGIPVFEEKENLLPFEEAKLYGHNAIHALAAYLGQLLGVRWIADLRHFPGIMSFLLASFIQESGEALIRKHRGTGALFTPEGFEQYAEDLLLRMTNPFLRDTVERVGRDCERKLGWDDRLIGTLRLALGQGIVARRFSFGVAAALAGIDPSILALDGVAGPALLRAWGNAPGDSNEVAAVLTLVEEGLRRVREWKRKGVPPLEEYFISVS